jgi:cell wall-associated NlpC family hydrolase
MRHFLLLFAFFLLLSTQGFGQQTQDIIAFDSNTVILISQDSLDALIKKRDSLVEELLVYADSFLGVPYRYAGRSRSGFDCSGFVSTMFAHIGIPITHSSRDMENSGRTIADSLIQVGDIVYFIGTQSRSGITHVGIVYEVIEDDVIIIHAAVNGGIRYDNLKSNYYKKHYYKTERIAAFDIEHRYKAKAE